MMPSQEPGDGIPRVKPLRQQVMSAQDQALIDAGKSLLASSATVGRDFAKTMVPVCTGAITLYFAGLRIVAPGKVRFGFWDGLLIVIPPMAFVLASVCFIIAFAPRLQSVSLNVIADVSKALDAIITRQHRWNRNGLWVFALATALSSAGLALAMLFWHVQSPG